jgi:hypothetical protein
MQRVPWEWEVSADLFTRDVADKGRTPSVDDCPQAQRSDYCDTSPRRKIHDLKEVLSRLEIL